MIVLDTNVVSELARPDPDVRVVRWFDGQRLSDLYLSAITVAEIEYGVARLPRGRRRDELASRVGYVVDRFSPRRIVAFDLTAARRYGLLVADRDRIGRPIATSDAQIAAICVSRRAALSTRNTRDFDELGLTLVNPWEEG